MKKTFSKLLALLLAICMVTPVFAVEVSLDRVNTVVDRIYSLSEEKRESLVLLGAPLIITDNGVDSIIETVQDHKDGDRDGMFDVYVEEMLKYADYDTIKRGLESIKCIPTSIRQKYVDIFDRTLEYELTSREEELVDDFMDGVYDKIPHLKPLLDQFDVSNAVVINLLCGIKEINGEPVFKLTNDGYVAYNISSSLQRKITNVWKGSSHTVDLEEEMGYIADVVNSATDDSTRKGLRDLFAEIGLIAKSGGSDGGSSGGGGGVGGGAISGPAATIKIEEIESLEGVETDGKIYKTTVSGGAGKVSFSGDEGMILKKVVGDEKIPVKMTLYSDDKIYAVLSESGNYVLEKADELPFEDCEVWGKDYISALYNRNIINGKTSELFMPNDQITREEFVKLIVEIFELKATNTNTKFGDVAEGSWYEKYVAAAYENGIINGVSDTEFGVGKNIKRQDMAKIINNVLAKYNIKGSPSDAGINDISQVADYAKEAVMVMKSLGIISGDENGNFNPNNYASRQEAAKMVYGLISTYVSNSKTAVIG